MKETMLRSAIWNSLPLIQDRDLKKTVSMMDLERDLTLSSNARGSIVLLHGEGEYDVIKHAGKQITVPTLDVLLKCAIEHYDLSAVTAVLAYGRMPVRKAGNVRFRAPDSSKYTNRISLFGHRFFPRFTLPTGTKAANLSKTVLGATRVFGIIGRASVFGAIGFAVFDVVSIASCAVE